MILEYTLGPEASLSERETVTAIREFALSYNTHWDRQRCGQFFFFFASSEAL
jgi:hypothetical protein